MNILKYLPRWIYLLFNRGLLVSFFFISIISINSYISIVSCFAQISEKGTPISFTAKNLKSKVPIIEMPCFDIKKMLEEDAYNEKHKNIPYRFAREFLVDYDIKISGVCDTLSNGAKLYRIGFNSQGAFALNFVFGEYVLPHGAKVFIYNEAQTHILGAFTSKNNKSTKVLPTALISGDLAYIEYYEPQNVEFPAILRVSKVFHAYKDVFHILKDGDFGASGDCNIDINCPEGADWQIEKRSVCRIDIGGGWCTGALINNTENDGTPYFLTANHCTGQPYSNWVFYFNYETAACDDGIDPYPNAIDIPSISGCGLKATTSNLDFCLVQMSDNPPESYQPYFAGWNRSTSPAANTTCIHHPQGDVKKISKDNDAPITGSYVPSGYDANSHWHIEDWELATTEPGSSGSPLFDENHRIIGDLTGGQADCINPINDYYAKFDKSWDTYSDTSEQLKYWLDPISSGVTALNGYDPTTSIDDYDNFIKNTINIYPNPSKDYVFVDIGELVAKDVEINIYNIFGSLIDKIESSELSDNLFMFDFTSVTSGMYLIHIYTSEQKIVKKILLIK